MIRVVHCNEEPYDIFIGRPSFWENPFSHNIKSNAKVIVESRSMAISYFERYARNNTELMGRLHELRNKTLGCWCKSKLNPKACHGDVYVKLLKELDNPLFNLL